MRRVFIVVGLKPTISKRHNAVLEAADLGFKGSWVSFCNKVTMEVEAGLSAEILEAQKENLLRAYTELGCIRLYIVEVTQ